MINKTKQTDTATLNIKGKTLELPVLSGTHGPDVVDVKRLYADAGVFTLDPGFTSTGSCESQITFIDGEKGILLHRGYPIDQLAEQSGFLEVAYPFAERRAADASAVPPILWLGDPAHSSAHANGPLFRRVPP